LRAPVQTLIHAPGLKGLWGDRRPAWMSWIVNSQARGILVAIDGEDTWLVHRALPQGETDFDAIDFDASIRAVLGADGDFEYEVINHEDWDRPPHGRRPDARWPHLHRWRCGASVGCRLADTA
jgi:hypothetical protein